MKNILITLFLFLSITLGATTYYIDPSGSDSNNGSSSSPWKTLSYACSRATSSGDIIHVNSGTYTETNQSNLAPGVSIEGVGVTSIIKSHVGGSNWTIQLLSSTQGTNGNQHISNIKLDGDNLTSYAPIGIFDRSNVEIYKCTFINFYSRGINFQARQDPGEPTTWATGNKFHDNTVMNCSSCTPPDNGDGTTGALMIAGQQSMLIYNNTLDQTQRSPGSNGFLIKGVGGYNKDIKIYNNTLLKAPYEGTTWDFAIEMWNCLGGIEIYNNTMTGSIDFSGTYGVAKGVYSYGAWIHNNIIGEDTNSSRTKWTRGVQFEQQAEGIIVEKNWFKNMGSAVYFPVYHESPFTFSTYKDITIRYNIFNNLGSADGLSKSGYGIYFNIANGGINVCNGFYVYNNVFIGHVGTTLTGWGIEIPDNFATISNVSIRNNIVENFDDEPVYGSTAVSGLSIENNIFYNNGHNNIPVYSGSGTVQKNLTVNPLFVSSTDFHLQAGSQAIGKGLSITGLTTDYDGNTLNDPPSIGAYESGLAGLGVIPVYQSSVTQNATPSLLEMTYNQTLANIAPATTSFSVLVNGVAMTVKTVNISGTKVQLALASAIKFGDVVSVSYSKPATNPLQTPTGGVAVSISNQTIINNLTNPSKDGTGLTITMAISPNHVHKILNVLLSYSSTPTSAISPEVIKISDSSGILFIEKLLVTGITNVRIPLNLKSGIYTVLMLANNLEMASQKIIVY
jgi:uncharacterized repeat protein (TIGR02059 family)